MDIPPPDRQAVGQEGGKGSDARGVTGAARRSKRSGPDAMSVRAPAARSETSPSPGRNSPERAPNLLGGALFPPFVLFLVALLVFSGLVALSIGAVSIELAEV